MTDKFTTGDRVELVSTDDEYTTLTPGDRGTITDIATAPGDVTQLWVEWDNGSRLAMLDGVDEIRHIRDDREVRE